MTFSRRQTDSNDVHVVAARSRLRERLGAQHTVTAAELVLVSVALLALAVIVFGEHVLHGGLYSDDWGNAAEYRFLDSPHYLHAVEGRARDMGSRPLLALLLPLPDALFGIHAAPQLALALVLGVLTCLLLYLLLRTLGLAPVHCGAIAALVLLFPWADSIRLWATASLNTVALCFGLLGLTVALRSLRRDDRKGGQGHALAIALFVLSILTYEVMALALLLTGLLYRGRAARGRVLRWWVADALAVGLALIYTAVTTSKQAGSASHLLHNVPVFARQSLAVLSLSFVPPGVQSTMPRLLGLALAGVAVAVLVRRQRRRPEAETRRLLVLIVAAALLIPCAYTILIDSYVSPLDGGYGNRGNLFAAFGYAALAYGLTLAVAKAVAGSRRRLEVVLASVLVVMVGTGYALRARDDVASWDRAAALQAELLHDFDRVAPSIPAGTTVVSFGFPADVEGAPVFNASWDLKGAVLLRTDEKLQAQPFFQGATLRCLRRGLIMTLPNVDAPVAMQYRHVLFADLRKGRTQQVRSLSACLSARRSFRPGPRSVAG
jgi:hypothetical protein